MPVVEILKSSDYSVEEKSTVTVDSALGNDETAIPKEDASANNSLENMESLLVQEDEDEEPLTESLLLSGSDGEDGENVSPRRQKKKPAKILDSDDENTDIQKSTESKEPSPMKAPAREGDEQHYVPYNPKKFSALIDSESEPEDEDASEKEATTTKLRICESDEEELTDGDTNTDSIEKDFENRSGNSKVSALIDSDSEPPTDNDEDDHNEGHDEPQPASKHVKHPQRASAKKAMDEIQAIQSETQRLYRETLVSIPYHKPKRHTLKEFLTRRTLEKPKVSQGGSGKKLKMTPEELEAYAKHLEERAKEAQEFFKSESEDELVDNVQENDESTQHQGPNSPNGEQTEMEITTETPQAMDVDGIEILPEQDLDASKPLIENLTNVESSQDNETEPEPIPSTSTAALDKQHFLDSTVVPPKSLVELKKRLLSEKNLPSNPTLKGNPNMMIDLETGDMLPAKPTGVETLMQRFIKSNAHFKKKPESDSGTLSTEKSVQDIGKIKVSVIEDSNKEKEPKPGAAYVKLKENLRFLITKKRKEDFQKKLEETQEEEDEYKKCCGLDDDEEEEYKNEKEPKKVQKDILIDDEENEIVEDEIEDEEPNDDEELNEEEEDIAGKDIEDEKLNVNEDAQDDEDEDNDDDESSESDEEENEDQSTKKHRVIKAFEDSDDENKEAEAGLNTTSTSVLYAEEAEKNPVDLENELLDLCSGRFEESQRTSLISQIPITQTPGAVDDTELMDLCSGVFVEKPNMIADKEDKKKLLLSSDEDNEREGEADEESTSDKKMIKKLKKKKKKRAKLGFSDDEDDEEDDLDEDDVEDSYNENEEDEIPQTFVDYDSEENEIEVQMSKTDRLKQAHTFLEKEAELSESEWGSADEDEENLDKYDKELGDEDQFDGEKIHAELEQIHMRKVLDDDIREVKKIQDMLFESEETDGVGRQRQFRWKNIESGFSLDDPAGGGENDGQIDSADDEEEMQWRKMRFEREQLLRQKTKEEILADISTTTLGKNLLATMQSDFKAKLCYTKKEVVAKEYKPRSFLIKQCDANSYSGSFLNCDKDMLGVLTASVLKSAPQNEDDEVQTRASKRGNFVFAPLSEEEMVLKKRKADEERNAKSGNPAKKPKIVPKSKSLLLDKLL